MGGVPAAEPDGYPYSRWCELYRAWEGRLSPTMRQAHPAGERMFVDYAGQTVDLVGPGTGEVRPAQIFVAVMGASNYTYAEATATQSLPDWIGAHVRALAFMGGVPAQLVPDNPKVGVDRANWYEPGLNRTYLDLATHYRTAILPTRTRKPRDVDIDGHYYSVPHRLIRKASRCAHHRAHDRAVPQGRARRGASARRRSAYDNRRAHAELAPALPRMDDRADRP